MNAARRNVELKVRLEDWDGVYRAASKLADQPERIERQTDTYFRCAQGRLKLREIEGQRSVLIPYQRPDDAGARTSSYRLIEITDPDALRAGLGTTLGIRQVVRKERRILMWKNVRIHLDRVDQLGAFLEFEAVLTADQPESLGHEQIRHLCTALGLRSEEGIEGSYVDLLEAASRTD